MSTTISAVDYRGSHLGDDPQRESSAAHVGAVALASFAYAGQLKSNPLLTWIPIDLTITLAAVVAVITIAARLRSGPARGTVAAVITLFGVLLLGLVNWSGEGYSLIKAQTLWTLTALAALSPYYLLRSERQRRSFLVTLTAIGSAVALVTMVQPSYASEYSTIQVFAGANTIGTGRIISTAVVICAIAATAPHSRPRRRLGLAILCIVLVGVTFLSGSRGPVFALAAGVTTAILMSPVAGRARGRALGVIGFLGAIALYWASRTSSDGFNRVLDFAAGQQDNSSRARLTFWNASFDYAMKSPAGTGVGDFRELPGMWLHAAPNGEIYPHNILMEVFVEFGWLAGFALVLMLVATLRRARFLAATTTGAALLGLLVFSLVNASVSGDLNDNRILWIVLGAAWAIPKPRARAAFTGPSTGVRDVAHPRGGAPDATRSP